MSECVCVYGWFGWTLSRVYDGKTNSAADMSMKGDDGGVGVGVDETLERV